MMTDIGLPLSTRQGALMNQTSSEDGCTNACMYMLDEAAYTDAEMMSSSQSQHVRHVSSMQRLNHMMAQLSNLNGHDMTCAGLSFAFNVEEA